MNLFANIVIDSSSILVLLLLYASDRKNREHTLSQMLFDGLLICMLCYLAVDLFAWCIDGRDFPGSYGVQLACNSLIYLAQQVCSFLWLLYTVNWLFRSAERIRKSLWIYAIPLLLEIVMLIVNAFTGWIFHINSAHLYVRGPLFLPFVSGFFIYAFCALFLCMQAFFRTKNPERRKDCLWMTGFLLLPGAATLAMALLTYGVSMTAPFYVIAMLMVYLNVHQKRLIDEKQKVAQRDAELQRAGIAIMLSQIQPHFLYNALTSIYGLCELNPAKAQEAVSMFSDYLRFNMDSLKQDRPISFSTELLHLKTYLQLEQMRFDDMLHVAWDIRTQDFMIPALTVQPLVENAVKHGLGKSPDGGTVTISTRDDGDHVTVTVADDGVGFDPQAVGGDGRSHIGIANVRERLHSMSRATLVIESSIGGGTTAYITIPKEAAQ